MESQLVVYIIVGAFQIFSVLGGGGMVAYKLGQSNQRQESTSSQTASAINEIKTELAALRTVMTDVALQKQELAQLRSDLGQLRQWYDELRHGEGLVYPFGAHLSKQSSG